MMSARYRVSRAYVGITPPLSPGLSSPNGVLITPTMRIVTRGPAGGVWLASSPASAWAGVDRCTVRTSPTRLWWAVRKCGVTTASSARPGLAIRPASTTGRSTVRNASAFAGGKPRSTPSMPSTAAP